MKVHELITKLQNLDPENEIWIIDFENGFGHSVEEVYSTTADKINNEPARFKHVNSDKVYPEGTEFSFIGTNVMGDYADDYDPITHTFVDDDDELASEDSPEDVPPAAQDYVIERTLHDVARLDGVIPEERSIDDIFFDEE